MTYGEGGSVHLTKDWNNDIVADQRKGRDRLLQ